MDLKLRWDVTILPMVKQKWEGWKLDISNTQAEIKLKCIPTKLKSVTVVGIHVLETPVSQVAVEQHTE